MRIATADWFYGILHFPLWSSLIGFICKPVQSGILQFLGDVTPLLLREFSSNCVHLQRVAFPTSGHPSIKKRLCTTAPKQERAACVVPSTQHTGNPPNSSERRACEVPVANAPIQEQTTQPAPACPIELSQPISLIELTQLILEPLNHQINDQTAKLAQRAQQDQVTQLAKPPNLQASSARIRIFQW